MLISSGYKTFCSFPTTAFQFTTNEPQSYVFGGRNHPLHITSQKAMLTQYAKEQGFLVVEIYVDDGYRGLNFVRPSFNRMLDDIEAGKIDVVITKDLSRLGRDHLKVGHFTEIYFPMKNVRYIAVNDGVDTANKNNDIAALKNVMNEFYSRDNSRKIRSSIRARAKAGL